MLVLRMQKRRTQQDQSDGSPPEVATKHYDFQSGEWLLIGGRARPQISIAPGEKREADYVPLFLSFMLHESPQQQHSCLSADELAVAPFVLAAPSFISHESPQQHSCLSDDVAWFFMPSFFII